MSAGIGGGLPHSIPDDPEEFSEQIRLVAGNLRDRAEFMEDLADKLEAGDLDIEDAVEELQRELFH